MDGRTDRAGVWNFHLDFNFQEKWLTWIECKFFLHPNHQSVTIWTVDHTFSSPWFKIFFFFPSWKFGYSTFSYLLHTATSKNLEWKWWQVYFIIFFLNTKSECRLGSTYVLWYYIPIIILVKKCCILVGWYW